MRLGLSQASGTDTHAFSVGQHAAIGCRTDDQGNPL